MKKRRMLLAGMAVTMFILFGGCGSGTSSASGPTENSDFYTLEKITEEKSLYTSLYRNKLTDVLYIFTGSKNGITEMHDPETELPLTYEKYKEVFQERTGASEVPDGEQEEIPEIAGGRCPECGEKIENEAKFCSNCGLKQEVERNE